MATATLVRHFRTSQEEVFRAWTDPALLRRWYTPNPGMAVEFHGTVSAGESYELIMGGRYTSRGRYLRVEAPSLIEFSWQWDGEPARSAVLVEFEAADDGITRLRLTHRDLADQAEADSHTEGWDLELNRLVILLDQITGPVDKRI